MDRGSEWTKVNAISKGALIPARLYAARVDRSDAFQDQCSRNLDKEISAAANATDDRKTLNADTGEASPLHFHSHSR